MEERVNLISGRNFCCSDILEHSRMHTKSRFSRWLKAAAILAVAECAGVADVQAQSSADVFRFNGSHFRYDKYRRNLFDPLNWERRHRRVQRRSDSSRASPRVKAKSKPGQSEPAASTAAGTATTTVENVPLPRPRPPFWPEPHSFAEAAGPGFDSA